MKIEIYKNKIVSDQADINELATIEKINLDTLDKRLLKDNSSHLTSSHAIFCQMTRDLDDQNSAWFKRIVYVIIMAILLLSFLLYMQAHAMEKAKLVWGKQFGDSGQDFAKKVTLDSLGNIYVTGSTDGSINGNTNIGGFDYFLSKYSPTGKMIWTKQSGTEGGAVTNAVAVDSANNVYVTGKTWGNLDGNINSGQGDVFLIKYDSSGNRLWTKQFGFETGSDEGADAIAVDRSGNIYVTGIAWGDAFIVKFDSLGNMLWSQKFGTPGASFDWAYSIAIDSLNNAYVVGYTEGNLHGNKNIGLSDAFLIKYDSSGNKMWTKQFGTVSYDFAYAVTLDNADNIYIAGYTGGSFGGPNAGDQDAFLIKYNSFGKKQWVKQFGTTLSDGAYALASDSVGHIYLAGGLNGGAYVAKYNTSGTRIWDEQFGIRNDQADGICIDSKGNIYVSGGTDGSLFNVNKSIGSWDGFIAKFVTPPSITSFSVPTFSTNSSPSAGFSISWNGTSYNSVSGSKSYNIKYRKSGTTSWSTMTVGGSNWTKKTKAHFGLSKPGYTYYFKVRVKDSTGNISAWSRIKHAIVPYDDRSLTYSGTWNDYKSTNGYLGTLKYTSHKDSYATYRFNGKSVSLIAPKTKSSGKIDAYIREKINGVWQPYQKIKTIDLYSATSKNRVAIPIKSWTTSIPRQAKLISTGTKNASSTGVRVSIDGLAVMR